MAQQIIRSIGSDGKEVLSNMLDKDTGFNITVKEINEFKDGTPVTDADVDNKIIFKINSEGKFVARTFDFGQSKQLTLQTVADIRNLSLSNILMFKLGVYETVKTLGYYIAGDGGAAIYNAVIDNEFEYSNNNFDIITSLDINYNIVFLLRVSSTSINGILGGVIPDTGGSMRSRIMTVIDRCSFLGVNKVSFKRGTYIAYQINAGATLRDLEIDFNGSTLMYENLDGGRMFSINNCVNVTIKNVISQGRMFEGVDPETVTTLSINPNASYRNTTHRFIVTENVTNIILDNVTLSYYNTFINFRSSTFTLRNFNISDGKEAILTSQSNGLIEDGVITDMRFEFESLISSLQPYMSTTIAAGSGIVLDGTNNNIICRRVKAYRCSTNTFRIGGTGLNVLYEDCEAHQGARHGFSIYGYNSVVKMHRCLIKDNADHTFWDGTPTERSYQTPRATTVPVPLMFSNNSDYFEAIGLIIDCPTYEGIEPPAPRDRIFPEIDYFTATSNTKLVDCRVRSTNTIRHKKIIFRDCSIVGYFPMNYQSAFLVLNTDDVTIENTDIITRTYDGEEIPDMYLLEVVCNNRVLRNSYLYGGPAGAYLIPRQSTRGRSICSGNTIFNTGYMGIYNIGGASTPSVLTNNTVIDCKGTYYRSSGGGSNAFNSAVNNSYPGEGFVMRSTSASNTAARLGGMAIIGDFERLSWNEGLVNERYVQAARLTLQGNNSAPLNNDYVTKQDVLDIINEL